MKKKIFKPEKLPPFLLPVILVLAALLLGLFLPSIVSAVQDRRADRSVGEFSSGTLNLKLMDNRALAAKLSVPLGSFEEVALKNGKYMTLAQAQQTLPSVLDIIRHSGLACAPAERFSLAYTGPLLTVSSDTEAITCIVWVVEAQAVYGDRIYDLSYAVDDETGMLIFMDMSLYDASENGESVVSEPADPAELATRNMAAASSLARVLPDFLPFTDVSYTVQATANGNRFYIDIRSDTEFLYSMPVAIYDYGWMMNAELPIA